MAISSHVKPLRAQELSVTKLVKYLCGNLPTDEVSQLEMTLAGDLVLTALLAKTYRAMNQLRLEAWETLLSSKSSDEFLREVQAAWMDVASGRLLADTGSEVTLLNLSRISARSFDESLIAKGILSCLKSSGLAPQRPELVALTRSRPDLPHLEGFEFATAEVRFSAHIDWEGTLNLHVEFPSSSNASGRQLWIAFDINRQWLRLGSGRVNGDHVNLRIPGFASLVGLSEGPLPPELFALRLDEWPTVCAVGALVVQTGHFPFAEIESEPLIEEGNVSVNIRLLEHNLDLKSAREVELWFGTGSHVWQLLGRWPIPTDRQETLTLRCPSPKPGPVGVAFPGVLKLALRP